jgi:hypothetical protein
MSLDKGIETVLSGLLDHEVDGAWMTAHPEVDRV